MAKFLVVLCLVLAFACCSVAVEEANNSSDPCNGVYCKKGRMCVASEDSSTRCVCPESCPQVMEPVCTFYNKQHNNTCEMHRFACRYGFHTAVKHKGPCTPEETNAVGGGCPLDRLLDFHDRYLDWLRIAYEEAKNLKMELYQEARLESLIDQERKKLIEWEFTSRDTNKNGILDVSEMKVMVDEREPCMVALISSCDFDSEPGISQNEWSTCFPLRLEGLENQISQEIL
ncbi:SPARC-like [Actinia tenebrosa]|uniref:SPARC-like n=1 Tax=Actinia tenebrosa TaxID=6105 RepID=A0A6P8J643_ACTTE|nr:SPARC-like [Actinia tenebrosa]